MPNNRKHNWTVFKSLFVRPAAKIFISHNPTGINGLMVSPEINVAKLVILYEPEDDRLDDTIWVGNPSGNMDKHE
uniref:Uncharacterized protein n=1 Tax=viral metagenome TaxID=1070528 RepID=A0A6C0KGF7_9ZZZZ